MISALGYGMGVMLAGGLLAAFLFRHQRLSTLLGAGSTVVGAAMGSWGVAPLIGSVTPLTLRLPWGGVFGDYLIRVDALGAFFAMLILTISASAALFGTQYLSDHAGERRTGLSWLFYNILAISMAGVVIADDYILFLLAWEIMSLSSFALVLFDHHRKENVYAGWLYFAATHAGTACLIAAFAVSATLTGNMSFSSLQSIPFTALHKTTLFILFLIGFGTKAGLMPLHIWLPHAHPAAPSHVSAVMSGVMIKVGVYGILRTVQFLSAPEPWWGFTLVIAGLLSGLGGVLLAVGQNDLKRMLAYSSVENVGIILCAVGMGVLGKIYAIPALAFFGCCAALTHSANHALFKSLLFFIAGMVFKKTRTLDLNRLGGLLKSMPYTGLGFLIGSLAICGIPLFNGFISELLLYMAGFHGLTGPVAAPQYAGVLTICGLALIGGAAVACFTRAFGFTFLGAPREGVVGRESPWVALAVMGLHAAAIILLGIGFMGILPFFAHPVAVASGDDPAAVFAQIRSIAPTFTLLIAAFAAFFSLLVMITILRKRLLHRRSMRTTVTWDCGYAAPTPRMQYSASSFGQQIVDFFDFFLGPQHAGSPPPGYFPKGWLFKRAIADPCQEKIFAPAFRTFEHLLGRLRWVQSGNVRMYVLYIAVALLLLVLWKLGWKS
jgi:formate hydrogenlyase subunit 3/multisubunit Na+/H+ antiporter MnhD subunit